MTRVVVTEFPESAKRELKVERAILGPEVEIVQYFCDGVEENLVAACKDAEDVGISVCAIDEYCTEEVADHTVLLMLALSRRFIAYHEQVQREQLWQFDSFSGLTRLRDMTLGIIGFGRIGQALARRAHGFGMTIIAYDHHPNEDVAANLDVRFRSFEELLAESDIVSLNCRLTSKNEQMLDADAFRKMNRKPIFINCARGGLVDETALVNALDAGQISAAGLDVLSDESPDLQTSGLIGRPDVILTPHMAFYSDASMLESREISAGNIRSFLDGKHEDVRRYVHRAALGEGTT